MGFLYSGGQCWVHVLLQDNTAIHVHDCGANGAYGVRNHVSHSVVLLCT